MRIAIKDETFETIYGVAEKKQDTQMMEILSNAKAKSIATKTDKKTEGAKLAAAKNAENKKNIVRKVYEKYIFENKKINVAEISKEAKIAYNTTKKYIQELQGI